MAVADGQMGIHVREERIVLGLDPGRDKTGFAFVDGEGELIVSGIFPSGVSGRFFAAVMAIFCGGDAVMNSHDDVMNLHDAVMNPHDDAMNSHGDAMNLHDAVMNPYDAVMNSHDAVMNPHGDAMNPHDDAMNLHGDAHNPHGDAMNLHTEALSEWIIEKVSPLPENISSIAFIAIGNGTHSKAFTQQVRAALPCKIITVDEKNTTLEARSLYWSLHAPSFWVRLLPEGLRFPARVLDDLAAWSIAVRGLKKYRDINQNRL